MASFDISHAPVTVPLVKEGRGWRGKASFSVSNRMNAKRTGLLRVRTGAAASREWFEIAGEPQRTFAAGETQVVDTIVHVPEDAPATAFDFKLRVVNEADPNDDWVDSQAVGLIVPIETAPADDAEAAIYDDGQNRIDSDFARFGSRSVAINKISAVDVETRHPTRIIAIPLFAAALWLALYGWSEEELLTLLLGLALAFVGWRLWRRQTLSLNLATAGGPIRPLVTTKPALMSAVRSALEVALRA